MGSDDRTNIQKPEHVRENKPCTWPSFFLISLSLCVSVFVCVFPSDCCDGIVYLSACLPMFEQRKKRRRTHPVAAGPGVSSTDHRLRGPGGGGRVARASPETVAINKRIALYASQKQLAEAKAAFQEAKQRGLANSHTFAAAINALVRCGEVTDAEQVLDDMADVDVVSYTTVMKGLCGRGDVEKAISLAERMLSAGVVPNVRTGNTLLRGCVKVGAVERSKQVLSMMQKKWKVTPDASSWEYVVSMLCRGLQVDQANTMIGRLKNLPSATADIFDNPALYLNLCRCCAILGSWKGARKAASRAFALLDASERAQIEEEERAKRGSSGGSIANIPGKQHVSGGKQGWGKQGGSATRQKSLSIFKRHRRAETREEIQLMLRFVEQHSGTAGDDGSAHGQLIADHLKRVYLVPLMRGPGDRGPHALIPILLRRLSDSFGLKQLVSKYATHLRMDDFQSHFASVFKHSNDEVVNMLSVFSMVKTTHQSMKEQKPVRKMEICSGAGEWVVAQAKADPASEWFSLEILHDRVYQIFCRSVFENCRNIAIVGGDASKVLPDHFPRASIDYMFVNYPEPPQQVGGEIKTQSSHLLTASFLHEMSLVVSESGMITIITDNEWYANLLVNIAATVRSITGVHFENSSLCKVIAQVASVRLYEGVPDHRTGVEDASASSYFDRLWQREQQTRRFFISLKPLVGAGETSVHGTGIARGVQNKKRKMKRVKKTMAKPA